MSDAYEDKNQALTEALEDLIKITPGIRVGSVVSLEGLPICHSPPELPGEMDTTRIAAMTAAMLSLGERAMMEVEGGELNRIMVEGESGYLISLAAGQKAVLTVSTIKKIKLGLIFIHLKESAKKIGDILDNP